MEAKEGMMNIKEAFGCRNCKTLVQQPNINQCCQLIICINCIKKNTMCPKCQNPPKYLKSNLLQQMFRWVFLHCPYECKKTLSYLQFHKHKQVCPQATIECPYCKKWPKIRLIPEHLGQDHIEECNRMLNHFQKLNEVNIIQIQAKEIPVVNKIKPFKHGTTGEFNIEPRISKAGRIVCGRALPQVQLPGQPQFGTSSLFSGKSKQICSPQFGSCDRCMELDVDRLGLPKTYLLNLQGRICCYLPQKRKVACGCMSGKVCNEQIQCIHCRKTLDLIERGFYKKCL